MIRRTIFWDRPDRGGSTMSTSGRPARSTSSRSARRTSPAKKCALSTSFRRAFAIASAIASGTISSPQTSATRGAISRPIVPIPQYRSNRRSDPVGCAYSIASR